MIVQLFAAASLVAVVGKTAPAATPPAAPTPARSSATGGVRLFPDSRLIVRDRISVEVTGHGPDLILIPGLASSRETWRATAERLRDRYRLHLVNVAGFAGEPARANAEGDVLAPTAEAVDAYIVQQKLKPATVIGHSLGGTMSLYLAEHHPDHLKKVLIVDALPFFGALMGGPGATPQSVRPMAAAIRASADKPPATGGPFSPDAMIARMVTSPENKARVIGWSRASDRGVIARAFADDIELDLRPGLASIPTPVTVLYPDNAPVGAAPGMMDSAYGSAFTAMPHKSLKRIDASLHFVMYDQPAAFDTALDVFLAS